MQLMALCALLAAGAVDAPFSSATVYSDRARVVRSASVSLSGPAEIELPALTDRVDPASIRVDADGAEVRRVELLPLTADELEVDAARKLLADVEQLDARVAQAQAERAAYADQYAKLQALRPSVVDRGPMTQPKPRLDPSGWASAIQFSVERSAVLQAKMRERDQQLEELGKERGKLAKQAALLGGAERRQGWKVVAHVAGNGKATVNLSYMTSGAVWLPRYEIQLDAAKSEVALAFYGLVQQQSGDDWRDVGLVLSTAIPSRAVSFPKVATWKIGEKDRFIPQPAPLVVKVRPPPAAPPVKREEANAEMGRLRRELAEHLGRTTLATGLDQDKKSDIRWEDEPERPRPAPPRPSRRMRTKTPAAKVPASPPPAAAPAPEPMEAEEIPAFELGGVESAPRSHVVRGPTVSRGETESVGGLMPPGGYVRPYVDPRLPAARAGGYDLAFPSVQRESIESGKGARKVALFTERWPVKLERRLYPAMTPFAYLAAEMKNPSQRVLPGGQAALFVGEDPAGSADLSVVAPGEPFTLPLGVDRSIKAVRNVTLTQSEKGFIVKDDVGEYLVTTEVANPYDVPVAVRIFDQWPLRGNDKVEVKLISTEPWAKPDEKKGSLEWDITIQPHQTSKVAFRYSIKRPKNWRMEQRQEDQP